MKGRISTHQFVLSILASRLLAGCSGRLSADFCQMGVCKSLWPSLLQLLNSSWPFCCDRTPSPEWCSTHMCTFSVSRWPVRYNRKCLFSCIYNPQTTISPTSSFSVSFNGNCVKDHHQPWTCPLSTFSSPAVHVNSTACTWKPVVQKHTAARNQWVLHCISLSTHFKLLYIFKLSSNFVHPCINLMKTECRIKCFYLNNEVDSDVICLMECTCLVFFCICLELTRDKKSREKISK